MPSRTGDAVSITSVRRGLSEDVGSRTRRYLMLMGIRTTCFVFAVAFTSGWLRWVCVVGAIVLPYVAVIGANAGRENDVVAPAPVPPPVRPALGPGSATHRDGSDTES
jgi:hypothetical protein